MPKRNLIWILIVVAMAAVLLLVWRHPTPGPTGEVSDFLPVEKTYDLIRDTYYQPVEATDLHRAAVRGMIEGLDEFSTHVLPGQVRTLNDRIMGRAHGLGLIVAWPDSSEISRRGFEILGVMPNSPAARADIISPGECKLMMGDNIPAKLVNIHKIRKLLNAPAGTKVELLLQEKKIKEQKNSIPVRKTVTLTSAEFPIATVQGLAHDISGRWVWHIPDLLEFLPQSNLRSTLSSSWEVVRANSPRRI